MTAGYPFTRENTRKPRKDKDMGAAISWLRSNWLALLIGVAIGRFLLTRLV